MPVVEESKYFYAFASHLESYLDKSLTGLKGTRHEYSKQLTIEFINRVLNTRLSDREIERLMYLCDTNAPNLLPEEL